VWVIFKNNLIPKDLKLTIRAQSVDCFLKVTFPNHAAFSFTEIDSPSWSLLFFLNLKKK